MDKKLMELIIKKCVAFGPNRIGPNLLIIKEME